MSLLHLPYQIRPNFRDKFLIFRGEKYVLASGSRWYPLSEVKGSIPVNRPLLSSIRWHFILYYFHFYSRTVPSRPFGPLKHWYSRDSRTMLYHILKCLLFQSLPMAKKFPILIGLAYKISLIKSPLTSSSLFHFTICFHPSSTFRSILKFLEQIRQIATVFFQLFRRELISECENTTCFCSFFSTPE